MSHLNDDIRVALDSQEIDIARVMLDEALKNPNAETYRLAALAASTEAERQAHLQRAAQMEGSQSYHYAGLSNYLPQTKFQTYQIGTIIIGLLLLISYFLPYQTSYYFFDTQESQPAFVGGDDYVLGFFRNLLQGRVPFQAVTEIRFLMPTLYNLGTIFIPLFAIFIILQPYLPTAGWKNARNFFGWMALLWIFVTLGLGAAFFISNGRDGFLDSLPSILMNMGSTAFSILRSGWGFWLTVISMIAFAVNRKMAA